MNKQRILDEILRTAKGNGGAPLGSRKFELETGIKTYEWKGKIWARWNDALQEAGFAPNQMRSAYPKAELLEHLAKLARQLGRIPSSNDLRLKNHQEENFPNQNVFWARFKSMKKMVQEVQAFCQTHDGYGDVVAICEAYRPRGRSEDVAESQSEQGSIGFVYLIKSGRFYKIGKTNSAGRREYELAVQMPEQTKTVHVIRTDDPSGIEEYWHKRFDGNRKNGEWFDLTAADIAAFKRRKFM